MLCVDCGVQITGKVYTKALISAQGRIIQNICQNCYNYYNLRYKFGIKFKFRRFTTGQIFDPDLMENEMPKAILSYEALQLDSEGIPTEGAYKLKLEGNFKTHIEPIVKFIKATIPSSDRTYDPTTYEWAFHERFWPLMEQAFKGSHFQVQFTVRKEDFVELKRKQAEFAKQAGQSFQTKQYSTDEDINKFASLLLQASIPATGYLDWTKEEAMKIYKRAIRFFHPDLHPERASQASELNEVFSRLKESYYIK